MKIVNFEQGTDEWLQWRRNKPTASRAGTIMGCSPWKPKTWDDLHVEMAGFEEEHSEFVLRMFEQAHAKEKECREYLYPDFEPVCLEQGKFTSSLDGICPVKEIEVKQRYDWIEIKCPYKGCLLYTSPSPRD